MSREKRFLERDGISHMCEPLVSTEHKNHSLVLGPHFEEGLILTKSVTSKGSILENCSGFCKASWKF